MMLSALAISILALIVVCRMGAKAEAYSDRQGWLGAAGILIGLVILCLLWAMLMNYGSARDCRIYGETTGREVKYVDYSDCFVFGEKGWQSKAEFIARAVSHE